MRALWLTPLVALLLAGCAGEPFAPTPTASPMSPTPPPASWQLAGSWTSEYTQDDIDAWCEIAREYDNSCLVLESFPPQFRLGFESEALCLEARERILRLDHIEAAACLRMGPPSSDPEQPTSSPPSSPAEWHLGGSFTTERTQDDVDAWCAVAQAYGNGCDVMQSHPEQWDLRFTRAADCDAARERIAAIPHMVPRECARAGP